MKKKILLYLASNSEFYTNLYPSIKKGFEEAGCKVIGAPSLLDAPSLLTAIKQHKPDFVFEMNRVKSEIKDFPDNVIHVCWLVDFWGRVHEELRGSDILYTWAHDWVKDFKELNIEPVDFLPPATDAVLYKPISTEKKSDFIFLGHISKNWSQEELNREVGIKDGHTFYFKDLLPIIQRFVLSQEDTKTFQNSLQNQNIQLYEPIDKTLSYDIWSRTFRQTKREAYLDFFIDRIEDISIYGSQNWLLYDKYKCSYKGFISSPLDINLAIQESNYLLHDGNYPHFRTFDAMASGVVVVAAKPAKQFNDPWEKLGFKSEKDYISVDIDSNMFDRDSLHNIELHDHIAKNAREKVLKEHLWVHRALKVLKDIDNL